ncbi:hypothetical protein [Spirosoma fluviale]|nr:hypothetical protein [Spirosoma fluviale]
MAALLLWLWVGSNDLTAQPLKVREDINPINDSLCWVVGTTDFFEFIINKDAPGENWVMMSVLTPNRLASAVGDSAWIILDDGYVINLCSSKNTRAKRDVYKVLYVEIDYQYMRFLAAIKSEDIRRMAAVNVKKMMFNLNPTINPNLGAVRDLKKHPLIPKTSTFINTGNHIEVRINKIYPKQRKRILATAVYTGKYIK